MSGALPPYTLCLSSCVCKAKLEAKGEGNKGSRERLEPRELRSRLFALFAKKEVYMVKELNREVQQSEVRACDKSSSSSSSNSNNHDNIKVLRCCFVLCPLVCESRERRNAAGMGCIGSNDGPSLDVLLASIRPMVRRKYRIVSISGEAVTVTAVHARRLPCLGFAKETGVFDDKHIFLFLRRGAEPSRHDNKLLYGHGYHADVWGTTMSLHKY